MIKIIKFNEETEYDEGGIHYLCFAKGEVGLFDEYDLEDKIVNELDRLCSENARFELFRGWNITEHYDSVIRLLQKFSISFEE